MTIEHKNIADPNIHEPKGAAAATEGQIYIADGAGSGTWQALPHAALYYDDIGTGTTLTTPVAYTLIGPATTGDSDPHEFTHNSLGRLTYTGATTLDIQVVAAMSFKHSTGAGTDVFFQLHKNGVAVVGAQHVQEGTTAYEHMTMLAHVDQAVTGDYFEVFTKTSSGNVIVHAFNMLAEGKL